MHMYYTASKQGKETLKTEVKFTHVKDSLPETEHMFRHQFPTTL